MVSSLPAGRRQPGIGELVMSALWKWARSSPRRMVFLLRVAWHLWRAKHRRLQHERRIHGPVPSVVAISPTMRCNYNCLGCYSRGRRTDNELSTDELDTLLTEAEELGVLAIVVTGGEPLLRQDMLDLMTRHRRLLFVPITNGSLVTPEPPGASLEAATSLCSSASRAFPATPTSGADPPPMRQPSAPLSASATPAPASASPPRTPPPTPSTSAPMPSSTRWLPSAVLSATSSNTCPAAQPPGRTGLWTKQRELPSASASSISDVASPSCSSNSLTTNMARTIAARQRERGPSTSTRRATSSPALSCPSLATTSARVA
jgi:hypothetical protein